jgi:hypothetical protein
MTDPSATLRLLADYYTAFSTLDPQAYLPYFHEPSLLIGPQGVFSIPTHAALAAAFAPVIENLRARDFRRSELSVRESKMLSVTAALVTGAAIRYKADGQEMERIGVTYVLHKNDAGWKIAVSVFHDADEKRTAV